ncbi:MAG: type IV pilus modification protein PilV [Burkholderiaceae bacterium]
MQTSASRFAGFALVEAMVTVVVVAFGLLGVAGLVSRSFVTEVDAMQRAQAAMLLQDMVTRIEGNRANAAAYVTGDAGITGYVSTTTQSGTTTYDFVSCDPATPMADRDRCAWGQLLAGGNEQIDNNNAGVLVGAMGCVHEIDAFNRVYAVTIAWQGASAGAAPIVDNNFAPTGCGRDQFGNENQRRLMTTLLRIGTLNPAP